MKHTGFTLIELLISVAIIGIISAVAVPTYMGYIDTSKKKVAQNNLFAIYLQQQEYFSDNNIYYSTGATCSDSASAINTNLFSSESIIPSDDYDYCILQTTTTDFTAHAVNQSDSTEDHTITNAKVKNF